MAWCEKHGDPLIVLTEQKGTIVLDMNEEPNSSFSVGYISSPKGRGKRRYKVDLNLTVAQNSVYHYGRHSIP